MWPHIYSWQSRSKFPDPVRMISLKNIYFFFAITWRWRGVISAVLVFPDSVITIRPSSAFDPEGPLHSKNTWMEWESFWPVTKNIDQTFSDWSSTETCRCNFVPTRWTRSSSSPKLKTGWDIIVCKDLLGYLQNLNRSSLEYCCNRWKLNGNLYAIANNCWCFIYQWNFKT